MTTDFHGLTTKLTVRIYSDEYYKLTEHLAHGQITQIMRKFVTVLNELKDADQLSQLHEWAFSDKILTLKQPKGT